MTRRPTRIRTSATAALALLCACAGSSGTPTDPAGPPPELTALPRALSTAEVKTRDAANRFSLALFGVVNDAQRDSNVFISPLSASFALGMTMNGAAGSTYSEMRDALELDDASLEEINSGYRSLIALLTSLDSGVQMQIANSIWYRQDFPFRQEFFDTTKKYFDATAEGLDFSNQAASLAKINGWVNTATNTRIPAVLDEISNDHVMFLINAIYFKGTWRHQFDPAKTESATFQGVGAGAQPVRLMHRNEKMSYHQTDTYQAVELPYGNSAFVMNVLLPAPGVDVETLAAALPAAAMQSSSYAMSQVDLRLPKLKLEYERTMNADLQHLGMQVPFVRAGADFTLMSPEGKRLFIDFVKQNTFVDINEEGTEAAAVTTVGIGLTSMPQTFVMRVDRPYIFVLRERLTGTILFMGKITRMPA